MAWFGRRSTVRIWLGAGVLAALLLPLGRIAPPVEAGELQSSPRLSLPASRLHRPEGAAPFLCGQIGIGGGFSHRQGQPGCGASLIFRPAAASNFLEFLYDWNTGMVLQADWQSVGSHGRALSADFVLRRYLAERGNGAVSVLPFFGGGFGASSAAPADDDVGAGFRYWSLLIEGGQEWVFSERTILLVKGQLRRFSRDGRDYSTWSLIAGVGLALPW